MFRGCKSSRDGVVDGEVGGLVWSQHGRGPLVEALGDYVAVHAVRDVVVSTVLAEIIVAVLAFFFFVVDLFFE